jgi:hypothetical protein
MNIIYQLPLPDELCSKIVLYAFKSPHIYLREEIFKRAVPKHIYQKLVAGGGIKKVNGHVTKLNVWGKYGNALLTDDERISIKFDIYVLHLLPNLTTVKLAITRVNGDIRVLQGLQNLTTFDLSCTRVNGDIAVLQGLQHLTTFDLQNTGVTGDIQVLQGLQHLTVFNLISTGVTGNIQALQGLRNLTHFSLGHNPSVTGDENAFHNYRETHGLEFCKVYM